MHASRLVSRRGPPGEGGFTTVTWVVCVSFTLLLVVWTFNLAAYLYGRGAVRAAVDEAARAGARVDADSVAVCQEKAATTLASLLGGSMGEGVAVTCAEEDGVVRARADVVFQSWLPPVPDWSFAANGAVIKEQAP